MSDSLRPHGLGLAKIFCPWDSPGKHTGVGCHFLLQEIFLTHGSNLGFLYFRQTLYHLSQQGNSTIKRITCNLDYMKTKLLLIKRYLESEKKRYRVKK